MAGEADLKIGQRVIIKGCEHKFVCLLTPKMPTTDARRDLQFEELRTGYRLELSHAQFDKLYLERKIDFPSDMDRSGDEIPEEYCNDKHLRDLRHALVAAFDENPVSKTDEALTRFIENTLPKLGIKSDWTPKGATLRTWLRTRGQPGDRRRKHMGRRQEFGQRNLTSNQISQQIFAQKAERYWQRDGVSAIDVWAAVADEINSLNEDRRTRMLDPVPVPDPSTIWRWIQRQTNYDNVKPRLGARKAKRLFVPAKTYLKPKYILELVIIDHTQLDCHTQDERFPNVVERPWLTLAIDSYSRCIVGFVVTFVNPSVETVMACLRQVIRPKMDYLAQFPEITREWSTFGRPQVVLSDRGMEFMGTSYIDALADVGISLELAPAKTPEFKGRGERFFDTLKKRLLNKLPGAVQYKHDKMKDLERDPVTEARITRIELEELILETILDYHRDFHRGLSGIPQQVWNKQAESIPYAYDLRAVDIALAKTGPERQLTSNGIEFLGLKFCSPVVLDLLNDLWPRAPRRGARMASVYVKFKYHPEDISRIYVWNHVRRIYAEIPCLDDEYTRGLSEFGHGQIRRNAEDECREFSTQEERCAARARTNEKALSKLRSRRLGERQLWRKIANQTEHRPAADEQPTQAIDVTSAAGIPVDSVSNRKNGDKPERTRTRKLRNRKAGRDSLATAPRATQSRPDVDDYFADVDRDALLASAEMAEDIK